MGSLHGSVAALEALVAGGADLSALCMFGTGVMHLAAMADSVPALASLASLGAAEDLRSEVYSTEVNDLMGEKASSYLQIVGVSRRTPLMVAAAEGHVEATRQLLELGADPSVVDSAGRRAVDYARNGFYGRHGAIVRMIERG